jgi:hypothetical protein
MELNLAGNKWRVHFGQVESLIKKSFIEVWSVPTRNKLLLSILDLKKQKKTAFIRACAHR